MIEIRKPDVQISRILPPQQPQKGVVYVPSQFVLSFSAAGKEYVFNVLSKQLLQAKLPGGCRAGEGFDDLIKAGFMVPEGKDECAFYEKISKMIRAFHRSSGIRSFIILPTFACNARCVYCYEEGLVPTTMTPETAEQVVRFIMDNRCREGKVHIHWFGGEPLLGARTIDRICEMLRDAGVKYRSAMTSNGSLITPAILEKMTGLWNLKNIQISMDGAEADYCARKRYAAYQDEYHTVMNAISSLSEAGIQVKVRCNVDDENWPNIRQYLADMETGVKHKERVGIYFFPLFDMRVCQNNLPLWQAALDAKPWIRAAGFKATNHSETGWEFRVFHCMADEGNVVIAPDGSLYACDNFPPESRFGDIWHGVTDEAARSAFCRADQAQEKCRKCPFLPDCTCFASCPVKNSQCREVRHAVALDMLRRMVEEKKEDIEAGETPVC